MELVDFKSFESVDRCPRCGETEKNCKCEDSDYWSTANYHRVPKGKKKEHKNKFTE